MAQAIQARVTAAEYAQRPETTLPMELIDGEIIEMPSPFVAHQIMLRQLLLLLHQLTAGQGELLIAPMDVHFDEFNVVQPDIFWVSGPDSKCKLGEDNYWHGAPDLVVEVLSEGTALFDRREKFRLYEKYGCREYWLAEPGAKYVEVWTLTDGKFTRLGVFGANDTFDSPVLSGLAVALKTVFDKQG